MASTIVKADITGLTDAAQAVTLADQMLKVEKLLRAQAEYLNGERTGDLATAVANNRGESLSAKRQRKVTEAALALPTSIDFGA